MGGAVQRTVVLFVHAGISIFDAMDLEKQTWGDVAEKSKAWPPGRTLAARLVFLEVIDTTTTHV